jgi:hypothetical protein
MFIMLEKKFLSLQESLKNNPTEFEKFIRNPIPVLKEAGIPLVNGWVDGGAFPKNVDKLPELMQAAADPSNIIQNTMAVDAENINAETYWWGVDITMNEKMTQDITYGTEAIGAIGGAIATALGGATILTGPVAAIFGLGLAVAFTIKIVEIKIIDNGSGVHWPITWLQWATLIPAAAAGPTGITAAAIVFIHPLRN